MQRRVRHLKTPATRFDLAFTDGLQFEHDSDQCRIQVQKISDITLPTGKIVAADPGNLDGMVDQHFNRVVPPGTYPVDLSNIVDVDRPHSSDTACMRVRFHDRPVVEWLIACTGNQDPDSLLPFEIFGYGVDVGMGSFVDSAGLNALVNEAGESPSDPQAGDGSRRLHSDIFEDFYFKKVLPAFESSKNSFANILLDSKTGANFVVCSSGYGDGFYPSYWGLSADGSAACLVTDFGLLKRTVMEETLVGEIYDLLGEEIEIDCPIGRVTISTRLPDGHTPAETRTLMILMSGPAANAIDLTLRHGTKSIQASGKGRNERGTEYGFVEEIAPDAVVVLSYPGYVESIL